MPAPPRGPGVSLIRPVCGLETFSQETLASSFRLTYPTYELIFCVARAGDPVVKLVERLIAAHPHVPARLVIGDEKVCENPKLNNCVRGCDSAQFDWIILADSNVLMPQDYIQQLLAAWRQKSGLVCSMPLGSRPHNVWAEFECAFLNTYEARWQFTGEALGAGFAQGKTMLWRRDILEAGGGIRALGREIAEDAAGTKLVRAQGRKIHLVDAPFEQPLGLRSLRDVWNRQVRWARMRRKTFPLYFLPEVFSGGALPLAFGLLAAVLGDYNVPAVMAALFLLWYGPESLLALHKHWPFTWRSPFLFLLRDFSLPAIYALAWCGDRFVWHGNAMDMRAQHAVPNGSGLQERADCCQENAADFVESTSHSS
ncbi:Ceramide glucosyltransferase [Beijerinckia indica subsp. indica ATCC 9039]|uniref:Ceramide glucosyltransferase n=1 Tax=Beijerinckia indica subsp. indica (strain ATCC 9039 / DSM 1715 / NCIMB 8712) TaxID=395963 RepID=B2IGX9_BEII9|nr:Ceramide glucosyltransferase [Beijerinckia indica subsp. indica ATCC 9039]